MADSGYVVNADSNGYTIYVGPARQFVAQAEPLISASASTASSLGSSALSSSAFGGIGAQVGSANDLLTNGLANGLTQVNQLLSATTNNVDSVIQRYIDADNSVAAMNQQLMAGLNPDLVPVLQPVPLPPPNGLHISPQVVDSIMRSEGASGNQGGVPEAYGFRQSMHNGYDQVMAARARYGQGSAQERAVVTRLLDQEAAQAGALNFTDPGEQAAIMSVAHMRGVSGAHAILNSMVTGHIQRSAPLDPNAVAALKQMSPSDFQQQLRDARINYDQTIFGSSYWKRYGNGLTDRYNREQQEFQNLSSGN